ncbi:hypothetical protein MO867_18715 [Microbulbifer sp. OS29]|uniref:Uncharacterized protein n=1 Tax=Microbulbifer okhotskensis TaxID=2926617 RepID=A0A9X2ER93_9GAMM|nr:hypothetical protein [Microbulbifer okhotskensis]MCO1336369.1 hypothetical protein [Microbulbifer okhotskensis]
MQFIANLRRQTLDAFASHHISADGYLLSAHRITNPNLQLAVEVRNRGLPLFADNGTKQLIDSVIAQFSGRAREITREVKILRRQLGHLPRGRDVPIKLRKQADTLAESVLTDCTERSESIDPKQLIERQLKMNPTDLIAQEDFASTCLVALDLEREITGWTVERIAARNRRSLRLWQKVAENPLCQDTTVYAVLSAMDYNTARDAGKLAADAGVTSAAMGLAGVCGDLNATDFFVSGRASFKLTRPVPRRYVRLAQIVKGIADGYRDHSTSLERFHCLGLGAPSLLPIAAAALPAETGVTADATSPIHAAAKDRVLYDPENFGDRASTKEIVERILGGGNWPFLSPFTQSFKQRFGHDPESARRWWNTQGNPAISTEILRQPSDLTAALPLFCEANQHVRSIARDTWIAHNHWVLGELTEGRSGPQRREFAHQIIDHWLDGPATTTSRGLSAAKRILLA